MAAGKKKAAEEGRTIVLSDESGFMLQPPPARTWAPVGQTPLLLCGARRDRVSAISAITVSPRAARKGFYFELIRGNFDADRIERFVRNVQRSVSRPVTIVFDRLAAHKTVATRLAGDKRFEFVFLPAYAPQLNPDEWVWRYAKHTLLGGCCPWGYDDLQNAVHSALSSFKSHSDLLASFFRGARLSL